MKLVRFASVVSGQPRGGRLRKRPQWLENWIQDQPHYALLGCGHKIRMNVRGTLIIYKLFTVDVFCDSCKDFMPVKRPIKMHEYLGITSEVPDVPLF